MADEAKELQCIDWRRCFAFLEIVRSFRLASHPFKVGLCFVGLALSFLVGVMVDQVPVIGQTDVHVPGIGLPRFPLAGFGVRTSFYDNVHAVVTNTLWGQWALPYVGGRTWDDFLAFLAAPLAAAWDAIALAVAYWREAPWFALVNTILSLAVWAVVGGAVTRMTAVRVAREEGVPLSKALRFSFSKWPSNATCLLIPFGVLVLLAVLCGLPDGLVLMVPYAGEVVVGLFWGLSLVFFFLLALVFVGGAFSVGLQWPTIAAEGSDSFDAISRSISYLSSRPWRYLFYSLFAAVYGCLTFIFVKFLVFVTLFIAHTSVHVFTWGAGGAPNKLVRLWDAPTLANPWPQAGVSADAMFGAEATAAHFFQFWIWVLLGMMVAWLFSFFFTSQTVIYFLLRKIVDATDMEEVYVEESEEGELPLEQKAAAPEMIKVEPEAAPPKPPEPPKT
jgi:hypothetical protein